MDELRALFTLAPQLTERIRDFRAERLAKIAGRAAPVRLMNQSCLTVHIVPFSSFDPGALLPLAIVDKNPHPFAPIRSNGAPNWFVNFDGVLITSNADQNAATQRAYTQVYRTGRIEASLRQSRVTGRLGVHRGGSRRLTSRGWSSRRWSGTSKAFRRSALSRLMLFWSA